MTDDCILCRCEEITYGQVRQAIANGCHSVSAVKRATRAGMGSCQGRTCSRLIQQLLAEQGICQPQNALPDKPRFPIVPCQIRALKEGNHHE